jgi:hypothetical protein
VKSRGSPARARTPTTVRVSVPTNVPTRVPTAINDGCVTTGGPVAASTVRAATAGSGANVADARGMSDNQLRYELLAVEAALRRIGRYRTYGEALRARDEDVLGQLAARGGWYTLIEHVIVGPGLAGPRTAHRHATALGVDPAAERVPSPGDLDNARHWLAAIRDS